MIGIVVPAHQEEQLIGACLRAVFAAARSPGIRTLKVIVIVVADSCTDRTAEIARAAGALTLSVAFRNVGAARASGAELALAAGAQWLAFTDADSEVAPQWLSAQLALGSDAVCGTVHVSHWGSYGEAVRQNHASAYTDADGHSHIHGANLGISASAYRKAGGFRPLATGEDVDLVSNLQRRETAIAWTASPRVITSARRHHRAPRGFGANLAHIERHALCNALGTTGAGAP